MTTTRRDNKEGVCIVMSPTVKSFKGGVTAIINIAKQSYVGHAENGHLTAWVSLYNIMPPQQRFPFQTELKYM